MAQQLTLDVALKDTATFDNFYARGNETLVSALWQVIRGGADSSLYLWGDIGGGRTHLLQACLAAACELSQTVMYLPLKDRHLFSPDILQGIEVLDLIALDDIDHISGDAAWEEAMFHFYNRHKDSGGRLLVSANAAPRSLAINLKDLKSRLAHGLIFHLQPLTDQDKKQALLLRAKNRGLVMPEDVANFLLKRCTRDMNSLFQVLEQLDAASMQAKRRLSIPFVRQVLSC